MAHHKRRRPKHQRRGCLFCKPYKDERESKSEQKASVKRRTQDDRKEMDDAA